MNEINPQYAPWLKKMLVLKLFSPGSGNTWFDHELLIHRERKGQLVGSLDRDIITEMRTKWMDMALPYLENPSVSAGDRDKLQKDIDSVKWAGICLDRLVEYESEEQWRNTQPAPVPMLKMTPAIPVEVVVAEPELALEEQSQLSEPALPPSAPLSPCAQDSEAPESNTEDDSNGNLFIQNPEGTMRRANFREGAVWLIAQCQAAYARLETSTDLEEATTVVHAQRLANEWADEIKADQLVRDHLSAILVRSLRRLGQIRAGFRKNGSLKRGQGGAKLYFGLDKNTLHQSDKLAKIEEDEEFEKRLNLKLKTGELTKYSTLEDPPAPKQQPESALFYRLMARVCEEFPFYKEGKYVEENPHEWAKCIMGGRREKIRAFHKKGLELLGPED